MISFAVATKSCNSNEVDGQLYPKGNTPRAPECMCWVWDDRMLSQQPKNHTLRDCSPSVMVPWVQAPQCNCTTGDGVAATRLDPSSAMANYPGRSSVFLPYYGYTEPRDEYPNSVPSGDNLSFPKRGACNATQKLGDSSSRRDGEGCVWKMLPASRMIYGSDLLAAGWNTSNPRAPGSSLQHEIEADERNVAAFNTALDRLTRLLTPRCCGC